MRENDDCVYVLAAWLLKYQRGRWWIARRQDRHAVKMRWHGPYRSLRLAARQVVPHPAKGSNTTSSRAEKRSISQRMSGTGFSFG